jgi:Uma2 family endonuclease
VATTPKILMTAAEFLNADCARGSFELIKGEVVPVSPGNKEHGTVAINVGAILREYGRRTGYGYVSGLDMAVQTGHAPDSIRGADIAFYSHARLPRDQSRRGIPKVPPDLVAEIVSPGNRPGDLDEKVREYLGAGVLLVWIVHPDRRDVTVYRPGVASATIAATEVLENLPELPGFRCRVSEFFE